MAGENWDSKETTFPKEDPGLRDPREGPIMRYSIEGRAILLHRPHSRARTGRPYKEDLDQ